MELNNPSGFQSRRSYPNLHHISLAPLTPRFPIDDDSEPTDYFSPRGDDGPSSGTQTPARSSYISSVSVPSTPPILSHSRSTSRTRHARSQSSTRAGPVSDTNLLGRADSLPLHHQAHAHRKHPNALHARRLGDGAQTTKSDAEWMLRAGIALASSTREEKGQSWLSKRESSTSLVSMPFDDAATAPHHHRTKSGASSRKSRSGASTPATYSRSRGTSRRGSRAGLALTSIPALSSASSAAGKAFSPETGTPSPEVSRRSSVMVPDFVDERIRAEMVSLQLQERGRSEDESELWDRDRDEDESEYDGSSDETPDDFDEADLQRLTRERGFGLGGWIDRLVEWTLFGVDEWPAPVSSSATRIGATPTTTTVTFEEPVSSPTLREKSHDALSRASGGGDRHDSDEEALSHTEGDSGTRIERPGSQGGWEDASWLFRMVKRTLI